MKELRFCENVKLGQIVWTGVWLFESDPSELFAHAIMLPSGRLNFLTG